MGFGSITFGEDYRYFQENYGVGSIPSDFCEKIFPKFLGEPIYYIKRLGEISQIKGKST